MVLNHTNLNNAPKMIVKWAKFKQSEGKRLGILTRVLEAWKLYPKNTKGHIRYIFLRIISTGYPLK